MSYYIKIITDVDEVPYKLRKHLKDYWYCNLSKVTATFIIYEKDKWCGYACVQKYGEALYFGPTFVKKKFRGKGFQNLMMKKKILWAKKNKYKLLTSMTEYVNVWSSNNLIKNGFTLVSHESKWLSWEKKL